VVLSVFETVHNQVGVLTKLRDKMLMGSAPNDDDLRCLPLKRMPIPICAQAEKYNKGLIATQQYLSKQYIDHGCNFIIFLFMSHRQSKSETTKFVAMPLTNFVEATSNLSTQELRCRNCLVAESSVVKILRCSGCRKVCYCNVSCQRQDWSRHKLECKSGKPNVVALSNTSISLADLP
jgi:hypothetical protein